MDFPSGWPYVRLLVSDCYGSVTEAPFLSHLFLDEPASSTARIQEVFHF
jgi:hypothetical protein